MPNLTRRLAVALDVPREAEPRRDVVPVRHVLARRRTCGPARTGPAPTSRAAIEPLKCSKRTPGLIVKRPSVQESCDVDALVGVHRRRSESCGVLWMITCAGHAAPIELDQVGRFAALTPEVAPAVLDARLEGVRAGDVRRRATRTCAGSARGSRRRRRRRRTRSAGSCRDAGSRSTDSGSGVSV